MPNVNVDRWRIDTMQALMSDVDEFLRYIAIVKTPEMDDVRDRLEQSLGAARRHLIQTGLGWGSARSPSHSRSVLIAAAAFGTLVGSIAALRHVRRTRRRHHKVR
jgi:ElaB/YqjD/DUF883 family membrane-anchored ribosome-binding protein